MKRDEIRIPKIENFGRFNSTAVKVRSSVKDLFANITFNVIAIYIDPRKVHSFFIYLMYKLSVPS